MKTEDGVKSQSYGVPLYGVSWVPNLFKKKPSPWKTQDHIETDEEFPVDDGTQDFCVDSGDRYIVFSGGGGRGRSGIRNSVLIRRYMSTSHCLSTESVSSVDTCAELPYRMAVHPTGDGVLCSSPERCMWLELAKDGEGVPLLQGCREAPSALQGIRQQVVLAFHHEGNLLALGSEEGELRVYSWPAMERVLEQSGTYTSIKDLDFSRDGKYLSTVGTGGPCTVWDLTSSTPVASLVRRKGEVFGRCRFGSCWVSHGEKRERKEFLFVTSVSTQGRSSRGRIARFDRTDWRRTDSVPATRHAISAFSASGDLLAMGTAEGDVWVMGSDTLRVHVVIKKAHIGPVTALAFSPSNDALASVSMDSTARVMPLPVFSTQSSGGLRLWLAVFVALLAVVLYVLRIRWGSP